MNGKINAANGDRFYYYGTELDDDVDIEVDSVGEVTVDTGDGDDTVTLTVKQEPPTRVDVDSQAIEKILTTEIIDYVASGDVYKRQLWQDMGGGSAWITVQSRKRRSAVACRCAQSICT